MLYTCNTCNGWKHYHHYHHRHCAVDIHDTDSVFHMQEELANLCTLRHYDWGVFVLKVNTCPSGNGQGQLTNVAIDDGRNKYGSNTGVLG